MLYRNSVHTDVVIPTKMGGYLRNKQSKSTIDSFYEIDERRTERANLSHVLDSLSFLIEFCCSLFVCSTSKGTYRITTTYYYARNKDLNSQIM